MGKLYILNLLLACKYCFQVVYKMPKKLCITVLKICISRFTHCNFKRTKYNSIHAIITADINKIECTYKIHIYIGNQALNV